MPGPPATPRVPWLTLQPEEPLRISGLATHGTYQTAQAVARLLGVFGWIIVAIGVVATLISLVSSQLGPFRAIGVMIGMGLLCLGLLQVAAQQVVRAVADTADYARQSLLIQAALAEGHPAVSLSGGGEAFAPLGSQGHAIQPGPGPGPAHVHHPAAAATVDPTGAAQPDYVVDEGTHAGRRWRRNDTARRTCR